LQLCVHHAGFEGFFRFNELSNLHIEWHADHIRIFVPRSKTDIYREEKFVYIHKTGGEYCSVEVLSKYMSIASIRARQLRAFLFRLLIGVPQARIFLFVGKTFAFLFEKQRDI
jgi:hypothetical protein